ncbi:radical SAM protein [Candidatus Sumerlaeota bacterium]|nr:radical SAM protein [Candidatus Sumerlaeota bacterium]
MRASDRQIVKAAIQRLNANNAARKETGLYPLELVLLYVTMRCNAKCAHCFCRDNLNTGLPEYTIEQLEKIAESMPRVRMIILTGGEPMLRADLADVFRVFASRGKVETVMINTNGLQPQKTIALTEELKSEFPDVGLEWQFSLDGLAATHDRIRGVPGNFDKVIESLSAVYSLKQRFPCLGAHALTVINAENHTELVTLNDYLREAIHPDVVHGFELMRDVDQTAWNIPPKIKEDNAGPSLLQLPPVESFDQIARDLKLLNKRAAVRANAFHIHNLAQLEMVRTGKPQYPCVTAGESVAVLYSDGAVAHCEFTKPFANLAEFDFDFNALWRSGAAEKRRAQIKRCHCTHGCFHGKSVEYSWKGIAKMAAAALL